ncbi:MAG: hypothetical protein JWO28_2704, partial [Hyphomicrobiales bacterium]|nr:hypothetical protein [Hyphomicrobiales bacterium]
FVVKGVQRSAAKRIRAVWVPAQGRDDNISYAAAFLASPNASASRLYDPLRAS